MTLIVQKYGGTSVGTPERIQQVAERIAATRQSGHSLVVVVSAMGQTTDELISLAHRVSKFPPHREMDMLLTAGERISMALLSMALTDRGVPAMSFTGSQSGIITTASHRRARIVRILGDRVRMALSDQKVVIVAGFQGVSAQKEVTTLGRGGSDTTAVALAATLGARSCEIYTDVDGVYSADPRIVPDARLWTKIGYDPMVQLAGLGAGVLHLRSVELARQYAVPVWVKNSLNFGKGTELVATSSLLGMEEYSVSGVTMDSSKVLVALELMRPSVVSALWDAAVEGQLSITAPIFSGSEVFFYVERESEDEWRKILQRLATEGFAKKYDFDQSRIPVSVVGERFSQDGAALSAVFAALSKAGISAILGSSSALSITVAVPRTHAEDAVRELHLRFFNSQEAR